jgi:hypothetical protein
MKNDKALQEFEDNIFDPTKNPDVKYKVDVSIECQVKYDFLVESYGKEMVDSEVNDIMLLDDISFFNQVLTKLENSK